MRGLPAECRRCQRGPLTSDRQRAIGGSLCHRGRGLCRTCYDHECRYGDVRQWGRLSFTREEVQEEYAVLRPQGLTHPQIAARLGMSLDALEQSLTRARRAERRERERERERELVTASATSRHV
jgi:hypothetical protein